MQDTLPDRTVGFCARQPAQFKLWRLKDSFVCLQGYLVICSASRRATPFESTVVYHPGLQRYTMAVNFIFTPIIRSHKQPLFHRQPSTEPPNQSSNTQSLNTSTSHQTTSFWCFTALSSSSLPLP
jgi:hypothetical protein